MVIVGLIRKNITGTFVSTDTSQCLQAHGDDTKPLQTVCSSSQNINIVNFGKFATEGIFIL